MAPVLSVIRGVTETNISRGKPSLLYGGRTPADIPDVPRIAADARTEFHFHPIASSATDQTAENWQGNIGFVHEYITQKVSGSLPDYEYYLAGPPPMIEATVRLLVVDHKVPASQIHFDRFF